MGSLFAASCIGWDAAAEDEASLAPARAFVRALVRAGVDLEAEVAATGDPVADAAARWSACVLRLGSLAGRREALEPTRWAVSTLELQPRCAFGSVCGRKVG